MISEQKISAKPHFSKTVNLSLLVGGYGVGQGAVFSAQTWLLAIGEYRLLAAFGTHLLFSLLGTLIVDAGSIITLARHAAATPDESAARQGLWRVFWHTAVVRMALALALVVVVVVYAFLPTTDAFSRNFAVFAAPALVFYAVNAAGLLDGFKFSGVSGLTGSIPYASSALALPLARLSSEAEAGALLGAAFSAGCLLTVVVQLVALSKFGWRPQLQGVNLRGLQSAAREGAAMLGVMLPGQLCGRAQLILSHAYLGAEPTALFLYAKQAVGVANQAIGFVQRIEFPSLVARMSVCRGNLFGTMFSTQKLIATAGVLFTGAFVLIGVLLSQWSGSRFALVAPLLSVYALTILAVTILIMMVQALAAIGAYEGLALDTIVLNSVGVLASYVLLNNLGVYAFVTADLLSTGLGTILLAARLQRWKQNIGTAFVGQQP